jgi:murein DD-endopeptidase MepM/ murein hydrolase activator NlpD
LKVSWNRNGDEGSVTGWSREGDGRIDGPADFAYPLPWRDFPGVLLRPLGAGHRERTWDGQYGRDRRTCLGYNHRPPLWSLCDLDHGDGLCTIHCHLSDITVSEGEDADRDEKICEMGTTGSARVPTSTGRST